MAQCLLGREGCGVVAVVSSEQDMERRFSEAVTRGVSGATGAVGSAVHGSVQAVIPAQQDVQRRISESVTGAVNGATGAFDSAVLGSVRAAADQLTVRSSSPLEQL